MADSKKMAISMPGDLARKVEKVRKKTGETRSAFIRRVIEQAFADEEEKELIKRYQEGYLKYPETKEEIEETVAISREILAGEPWE